MQVFSTVDELQQSGIAPRTIAYPPLRSEIWDPDRKSIAWPRGRNGAIRRCAFHACAQSIPALLLSCSPALLLSLSQLNVRSRQRAYTPRRRAGSLHHRRCFACRMPYADSTLDRIGFFVRAVVYVRPPMAPTDDEVCL